MRTFEITKRATHYIATRGNDNIRIEFGFLSAFVQTKQAEGFKCKMIK